MKKIAVSFCVFFVFISCKKEIKATDLSKINGYWEIEKVILASGEKKEYKISETIDFFELKKNIGFRKKVTPQIDGKYFVNDVYENISISAEKEVFFISYKTNYLTWKEEIVALQDSILILKNNDEVEYHYKKHIPFSVK